MTKKTALPESVKNMLDAAIHCVGRVGYEKATTRDIADRAGVSRGLVHYHFDSKEELLLAALSHMAVDVATKIWAHINVQNLRPDDTLRVLDDLYEYYFSDRIKMSFLTSMYGASLNSAKLKTRVEIYRLEERKLIESTFQATMGPYLEQIRVPFERIVGLIQTFILGLSVSSAFIHDEEEIMRRYQDIRSFIAEVLKPAIGKYGEVEFTSGL
ncbi:MAG: helix-turn-helix domain-containing protein [Leptospirales bacterium]